jgi:maleamate amidohydrolase
MTELDIYRRQNYGNSSGFGRRPALLIIDFQVGFADPTQFGGGNIKEAITRTAGLLERFRAWRLPIAFSRTVYAEDGSDAGVFCLKAQPAQTDRGRADQPDRVGVDTPAR